MMTIDDMLSKIAEINSTAPKESPKVPQPKKGSTAGDLHIKKESVSVNNADSTNSLLLRPVLPLSIAKEIIYCVECGAQKLGVNAVVSIVNAQGALIALEAMDGSLAVSLKASQDKAYTAAALKMDTVSALKESRGGKLDGLTNGDGILLLGGGCPLFAGDTLIGAVGVSGGTKDEDNELAMLGVRYFKSRIKTA